MIAAPGDEQFSSFVAASEFHLIRKCLKLALSGVDSHLRWNPLLNNCLDEK